MFEERKIPSLVLKIGVKHALVNGEKRDIKLAPKKDGEGLLIPSEALKLAGINAENSYTAFEEIDGIQKAVNSMGIILFDGDKAAVSLDERRDLEFISYLAHRFIFDIDYARINTSAYAPATEEERAEFKKLGEHVYSILKQKNNTRPYIEASKDIFEKLRKIYKDADGSDDYIIVKKLVDEGLRKAEKFPQLNDEGNGLTEDMRPTDYIKGYDAGGRHSYADNRLAELVYVSLAAKITDDKGLARLCYYVIIALSRLEHWGPGHFLNTAVASYLLAEIYDWLYDDWRELNLNTGVARHILYTHGLHHGFNSAIHDTCDYPSDRQGTGWRFKLKHDNWNTVCNGGMIISALAFLGEDSDEYITEEMMSNTKELLGAALTSYLQYDLLFTQYSPDGSYVESSSYWAFGTGMLAVTLGALYTALGTDLGIHNAIGLDKTCRYAVYSEGSDHISWNYHDGHLTPQNTSSFNIFATLLGDYSLFTLRKSRVKESASSTPGDVLFLASLRGLDEPPLDSMPLDYHMKGIDAFVVKNGWDDKSLYAGIIGGENPEGGSHNHVDSGAFVYHNYGKVWLSDLGCDNYNIDREHGGYFGNYHLYRRNGEGHNIINLRSLPYGQLLGCCGYITEVSSSEHISYCTIDNTEVYGKDKVEYAGRGMALIDRQVLVIADRIQFKNTESAFWSAHFENTDISAEITDEGKKCILTHKDGERIYITLQCGDGKFEIMGCCDFLLDGTAKVEGEHSRENFSRIVVKLDNIKNLDMAVAISPIDEAPSIPSMEAWSTLK